MARQKGIVILKGTIGNLNFYVRKGEPTVRTAGGGFNGKAIKNKASMIRVRENGSEFGGCAKAVKHFKMAINPFLTLFSDGTRHQRLIQLFTQIKQCDEASVRGKRNVGAGLLTEDGRDKLKGYVITPGDSLATVLQHPFRFEWGSEGLVVPDFSISGVRFPNGATHFEVEAAHLIFDFDTYDFSISKSTSGLIGKDYTGSQLQVVPDNLPEANGIKIGIVFFRFMQEINGKTYPLKADTGTVLELVYVGH